jgi:HlyD family secretion protein
MMDVARPARRSPLVRHAAQALFFGALALAALAALPWLFKRTAALPALERSTIVVDTARRGTLIRAVQAPGQLVPERVQVVSTAADGIVAALPIRAGSRVVAGDPVAELQNPDLQAAVEDARAELAAAGAELRSAREEASAERLDQESAYRTARAEAERSGEEVRSYAKLHAAGLVADLAYRETAIKADENLALAGIAQRKIGVAAADAAAKVAAAQARVDELQADLGAREARVAALVVRAGSPGIVQSVAVEPGQRVAAGAELARIAEARDLKAVLQVAESDAHGVAPGMAATIDTNGDGTMAGRVERIAPAAQSGAVAVDVRLRDVRPGVRPDQSVAGTVELSRARDVVSIARPAGAPDNATVSLYVLDRDGTRATRTAVRLGSGSLDRVRVLAGIAAGDTVIVSDTSAYDAPQLRIQ